AVHHRVRLRCAARRARRRARRAHHRHLPGARLRGAHHDADRRGGGRPGEHRRRVLGQHPDRRRRHLRARAHPRDRELPDLRRDGAGAPRPLLGAGRGGHRLKSGPWIAGAVAIGLLAAAPWLGISEFQRSLLLEVMIFSILAMSLNLILGYAGLVSFGHAAFFAVGSYAAGLCANYLSPEIWLSLPFGIVAGVLLALPVGWLSIRLSGFYFLMITFALAQMVY